MSTLASEAHAVTAATVGRASSLSENPAVALTFDAVYEAHFDFVWRSVRGLGVPPASVDDAAQDVFIVVHRRLREFEARAHIRSWLFGIALRVARDYRRSAKRKGPQVPLPETLQSAQEHSPFDGTAKAEAMRFVEAFLDTLNDDKRAVFVLAELEQVRPPEIAEMLDLNVNTVYSRLRAVRQEFAQAVAERTAKDTGGGHE
ncbi:MAG TPA: RNA polymerase sigma factor [Polyangiales bacterium]